MTFKINNYSIIKNAVSSEIANFAYEYLLLKRQVCKTLLDTTYISPFNKYFGEWEDSQVPNTYSIYGDVAMETLLMKVKPLMEKETGLNLIPTYAYARVYKRGDVLKKHIDRPSCKISTTMNLGGEKWPIYLKTDKVVKIELSPGDMLIYSGCELEHWREPFEGENCGQVFLHYNDIDTQGTENRFDKRLHLGLPFDVK
jgi:hypothetical protein|tara:strand:+ start:674 stop:1270 length:597 start_codon:yes stop_codon:yes gene_type:complete